MPLPTPEPPCRGGVVVPVVTDVLDDWAAEQALDLAASQAIYEWLCEMFLASTYFTEARLMRDAVSIVRRYGRDEALRRMEVTKERQARLKSRSRFT